MIRFRVNGTPAPQGSKRHVGNGRMVESSRAVGPWREAVRAEAQRALEAYRHGPLTDEQFMEIMNDTAKQRWNPGLKDTGEPVSVTVVFVIKRPAGHLATGKAARAKPGLTKPSAPKYPAKRPDVDKLARAVLDGLVMGGVMADDAQVVRLNCAKVYASNGEAPGAIIEVEAM